jgi:uncharacterized protein (DUF2062 family)
MTAGEALSGDKVPEFSEVFGHMMEATLSLDMTYLIETAGPIFWPMLVSSIPTGFVIWWAFYLPLKYVVRRYQERRKRKLTRSIGNKEPSR